MASSILLKGLPCLAALLGASGYNRQVPRFYFELTNLIKGQDVKLAWHFKDENRTKFRFFCMVTNADQSETYYSHEKAYDLTGQTMPFSSTLTIAKTYTRTDELCLYFGVYSTTSDNWSDIVFTRDKLGTFVTRYGISGDASVNTGRHISESDIYGVNKPLIYYTFEYVKDHPNSNSLQIENWIIRQIDSYSRFIPFTCDIELRLLDHLDEWRIGSKYGGAYGYVSIPLSFIKDTEEDGYRLMTKYKYAFDRLTGEMKPLVEAPGTTYFQTRNIFASGISNSASANYRYQIFINNANGGDNFMIEKTVQVNGRHYGNCEAADYCVVIGGE